MRERKAEGVAGVLISGASLPANRHSSKDEPTSGATRLNEGLDREQTLAPKRHRSFGPMAEWLRRGLQILARRFDSGSGLHAHFET